MHKISKPGLKRSVSHLVSGVDVGPSLEEYPHHTGVTLAGCYYQRSVPTLWGKEEWDTNMLQSYGHPVTLQSISWLLTISSWYVMFMASWHLSLLQCLTTGGLQTKIITGIPVSVTGHSVIDKNCITPSSLSFLPPSPSFSHSPFLPPFSFPPILDFLLLYNLSRGYW